MSHLHVRATPSPSWKAFDRAVARDLRTLLREMERLTYTLPGPFLLSCATALQPIAAAMRRASTSHTER